MTGLRESIQVNRKLLITTMVFLAMMLVFVGKFYRDQKKENHSLKLQLLLMSESKKTPKAWKELINQKPIHAETTQVKKTEVITTTAADETKIILSEEDTQTLAKKLDSLMIRAQDLDEKALDFNIELADEIISREPDTYGAYKAKLISLLIKEGKFNQDIDDSYIENLLENMAQFSFSNEAIARKEAALMSKANIESENLEMRIEQLAIEREALENQQQALDSNSDEFAILSNQINILEEKQNELLENTDNAFVRLADQSTELANEDVVEIPFMRLLAKNEFEAVISNARSFIEQFPESPKGYFYLTRALELQGNKEEAMNVIQNSTLPGDVQSSFIQRLENESKTDPKAYWQKLNF